jgi:ATP-dependent Clp protease ATP-binding subunit ClpX
VDEGVVRGETPPILIYSDQPRVAESAN